MREILYRAKSLYRGEGWVYGQPRHYALEKRREKWTMFDPYTGIETDIVEDTLGQYTGLTDKNGNKIFEGDIVTLLSRSWKMYNAKITFNKGGICVYLLDRECLIPEFPIRDLSKDAEITIIGNIHDNPELTKGGEK
ncbi:MAG: hypothetical protein IKJ81_09650 [Bacteroidales bacterium]|nr:hypothetical protein [Bacteroidales bacterium]